MKMTRALSFPAAILFYARTSQIPQVNRVRPEYVSEDADVSPGAGPSIGISLTLYLLASALKRSDKTLRNLLSFRSCLHGLRLTLPDAQLQ
jgi:hypothetical protein